jgi:hypothetical protein
MEAEAMKAEAFGKGNDSTVMDDVRLESMDWEETGSVNYAGEYGPQARLEHPPATSPVPGSNSDRPHNHPEPWSAPGSDDWLASPRRVNDSVGAESPSSLCYQPWWEAESWQGDRPHPTPQHDLATTANLADVPVGSTADLDPLQRAWDALGVEAIAPANNPQIAITDRLDVPGDRRAGVREAATWAELAAALRQRSLSTTHPLTHQLSHESLLNQPLDQGSDQSLSQPSDQPSDQGSDRLPDQPLNGVSDQQFNQLSNQPSEQLFNQPPDQLGNIQQDSSPLPDAPQSYFDPSALDLVPLDPPPLNSTRLGAKDDADLIPLGLIRPDLDPRWLTTDGGLMERGELEDWDRACATLEWEYKVVRSPRHALRNPAAFDRLCREEAQAGWMLLETLDDRRLRFKRPTLARLLIDPSQLSFDPYRTTYPQPFSGWRIFSALALMAAALLPAYVGYTWVSIQLQGPWREDLPLPVVNPSSAKTSLSPPAPE